MQQKLVGEVRSWAPFIGINAVDDPGNGHFLPWYCVDALSSMTALQALDSVRQRTDGAGITA